MKSETFWVLSQSGFPDWTQIFGSRFIDQEKDEGSGMRCQSGLAAQNYENGEAADIARGFLRISGLRNDL